MLRREVHGHEVKGEDVSIRVVAMDWPDDSGASHLYRFEREDGAQVGIINFHNGEIEPWNGKDVNGVTMESLIVMMMDRLEGLQKAKPSKQHGFAYKRLKEGLEALHVITKEKQQEKQQAATA